MGSEMCIRDRDYTAKPLAKSFSTYPFISRKLPEKTDWAMQTKLRLVSRQFGDYDSGLMVLLGKGTKRTRYTIGFDDGVRLAVKKVDSKGNAESIYTKSIAQEEMPGRISSIASCSLSAMAQTPRHPSSTSLLSLPAAASPCSSAGISTVRNQSSEWATLKIAPSATSPASRAIPGRDGAR